MHPIKTAQDAWSSAQSKSHEVVAKGENLFQKYGVPAILLGAGGAMLWPQIEELLKSGDIADALKGQLRELLPDSLKEKFDTFFNIADSGVKNFEGTAAAGAATAAASTFWGPRLLGFGSTGRRFAPIRGALRGAAAFATGQATAYGLDRLAENEDTPEWIRNILKKEFDFLGMNFDTSEAIGAGVGAQFIPGVPKAEVGAIKLLTQGVSAAARKAPLLGRVAAAIPKLPVISNISKFATSTGAGAKLAKWVPGAAKVGGKVLGKLAWPLALGLGAYGGLQDSDYKAADLGFGTRMGLGIADDALELFDMGQNALAKGINKVFGSEFKTDNNLAGAFKDWATDPKIKRFLDPFNLRRNKQEMLDNIRTLIYEIDAAKEAGNTEVVREKSLELQNLIEIATQKNILPAGIAAAMASANIQTIVESAESVGEKINALTKLAHEIVKNAELNDEEKLAQLEQVAKEYSALTGDDYYDTATNLLAGSREGQKYLDPLTDTLENAPAETPESKMLEQFKPLREFLDMDKNMASEVMQNIGFQDLQKLDPFNHAEAIISMMADGYTAATQGASPPVVVMPPAPAPTSSRSGSATTIVSPPEAYDRMPLHDNRHRIVQRFI